MISYFELWIVKGMTRLGAQCRPKCIKEIFDYLVSLLGQKVIPKKLEIPLSIHGHMHEGNNNF